MMKIKMSNKGVSILGAVITLVVLGIFGAAIVALVSTEQESRRLLLEKEQAFYAVQAGLEYAIREIVNGGNPVATNKQIGRGTFTNVINYAQHSIAVTGRSGEVSKTHTIDFNQFGGDCLGVNNDQVTVVGPNKTDMKANTLRKNCNNAITIDKFQFTWGPDNGEKITRIELENNTVYNDANGSPSGAVIDIADYTLSGGTAHQLNLVRFTDNMLNKSFSWVITLSDGSYNVKSFVILPPNQK